MQFYLMRRQVDLLGLFSAMKVFRNFIIIKGVGKNSLACNFFDKLGFFQKSDKRVPLLFSKRSDVGVALLFLGRERSATPKKWVFL